MHASGAAHHLRQLFNLLQHSQTALPPRLRFSLKFRHFQRSVGLNLLAAFTGGELPASGAFGTATGWHVERMPYHRASRLYLPGSAPSARASERLATPIRPDRGKVGLRSLRP